MIWGAAFGAVRTLLAISRRRGHLMDLRAVRGLSTDERLELQQHDGHIGRWLTTGALVAVSGLAVWGWGSGAVAKARVHGLERDLAASRVQTQQAIVERDAAREAGRVIRANLESERTVRAQCEARWETSQAMCARVIGDGARRSETRVRRDAARKRGAVDAITKPPATVGEPVVSAPVSDPRSLLLAVQADADAGTVPSVPSAAPADSGAPDLRGRTDPNP